MKSTIMRTPARLVPKTPLGRHSSAETITDPVQVYCRIRPINSTIEQSCVEVISSKTVSLRPPEMSTNYKISALRETQYTFQHVFDQHSTQREVYERVAQPLVENLIKGKNGLLFTYGVTSSGKTYTMTGNHENRGIMPRCLESLFKTISDYQTKKFVFKPDRMNGFEILSEEDALLERQAEMNARFGKNGRRKDSDPEIASQASNEASILDGIIEDNMYAVFVTYIEVYNNSVYDLLEDGPIQKTLQTKIIRGDEKSNMYVHGVTEIEVKTVSEAIEAYHMGQKRKRTGHTILNSESSRSHSVFTIRLVQAPTDSRGEQIIQDRRNITISQLSLVDLAGSERTNRTNNTGQRLREAGNINNSLMTLRKCLETLRENQNCNVPKKVPYRDAKITHLFKNYFDGEGQVRMVVCINPRREDFDETTQVMKFAEMTQEVQVARPTPMKMDNGFTPGRRKANQIFKMAVHNLEEMGRTDARKIDIDIGLVYSLGPKFPDYRLISPETDELIVQLMQHLDQRIQKRTTLLDDYNARQDQFRMQLVHTEQEMGTLQSENSKLNEMLKLERNRTSIHEKKIETMEYKIDELSRKLRDREIQIKELQTQINQKQYLINQKELDQERQKRKFESKIAAETEKVNRQLTNKFKAKEDMLQDRLRSKHQQIHTIKKIANLENMENVEFPLTRERSVITDAVSATPKPIKHSHQQESYTPRAHRGVPVANVRHRRSRSTDERWLEHRAPNPVPLGTILQPYYKNRKSITKLTDAKDIVNSKTSKYCLVSQAADTDGEVETRLYKGNVIPTSGGGAQVVFNDVECLKQKSPVTSPTHRKRPSDGDTVRLSPDHDALTSRCSVGLQGSKKTRY